MLTAARFDRGGIATKPEVTPEGYLVLTAEVARPGILAYRDPAYPGGIRYELVRAEDLAAPQSLDSFKLKAACDEHPVDHMGRRRLVTPDTERTDSIGTISEVEWDERAQVQLMRFVVRDRAGIEAVRSRRKVQVSPGYEVHTPINQAGNAPEYATPSNPTGRYDLIQGPRTGNHLAITDNARGERTAVRLDSRSEIDDNEREIRDRDHTPEPIMRTALLALLATAAIPADQVLRADAKDDDPISVDETSRLVTALRDHGAAKSADAAIDVLGKQLTATVTENARLRADSVALQAKVDTLTTQVEQHKNEGPKPQPLEERAAWFDERTRYLALAEQRGVRLDSVDKMENIEIARAIAASINDKVRADSTDEYVLAVIDLAADLQPGRADAGGQSPYAQITGNQGGKQVRADADDKTKPSTLADRSRKAFTGPASR